MEFLRVWAVVLGGMVAVAAAAIGLLLLGIWIGDKFGAFGVTGMCALALSAFVAWTITAEQE